MVQLTITIPTYNRPEHIQTQVHDVLAQLRPGVNLVVYDNCSEIPVDTLFTEEEKHQFVIKRNITNIGGDANNAHCLENVSEGWVWLLGDDDRIRPDAVDVIIALIESHPDCCYINTANKRTQLIESFDEFLSYFKMRGAWGKAFFQSACLFNMSLLRGSLIWYYNFLSSQMGQICMVIKHLELNADQKVFFTTENLIVDKEPGGWDPMKLVVNSLCIVDKFHYCRKIMRPNIFASLGNMYLDNIAVLKGKERRHYLWFVIRKIGLVSLFRYNYYGIVLYLMTICLPTSVTKRIHDKIASKYNKAQSDN